MKRPFVLINMSMTADGKIATTNRLVSSFGSKRDHTHLLELRATTDAVMCGARTADLNEVNLGPGSAKFRKQRVKRGLAEYNLRIIVTGRLELGLKYSYLRRESKSTPAVPLLNVPNHKRLGTLVATRWEVRLVLNEEDG